MKTLHLHIGYAKTGSSSIQNVLVNYHKLLNTYDFYLFDEQPNGKKFSKVGHAAGWSRTLTNYNDKVKLLADKLSVIPYSNIIMSNEDFPLSQTKESIKIFYDELIKSIDQIIVYAYIRRQDTYVRSLLGTGAQIPNSADYGYKHNFRSLPLKEIKFEPRFCGAFESANFYDQLSIWGDIFGDANMHIRVFEKSKLYKQDPAKDFLNLLGIQIETESTHWNISPSFTYIKLLHLLNKSKLNFDLGRKILTSFRNEDLLSLPSRAEAMAFYDQYRQSNIELNKRFNISPNESIFNEDFSMYPEEPQDLWTEEKANKAILNIFNAIPEIIAHEKQETINAEKLAQEEQHKKEIANLQEKLQHKTPLTQNCLHTLQLDFNNFQKHSEYLQQTLNNTQNQLNMLRSYANLTYLKRTYLRYRIASEITVGKTKKRYKAKKHELKSLINLFIQEKAKQRTKQNTLQNNQQEQNLIPQNQLDILKEYSIPQYLKFTYLRYRIASEITFGKTRKRYKQKKHTLKQIIRKYN